MERELWWAQWAVRLSIVLVVGWTIAIVALSVGRFAIYLPRAELGEEAATALAALFGSLIVAYFPSGDETRRLRWVALALAVLGCGALFFGYLLPLTGRALSLDTTMYAAIAVRIALGALLVVGLVPARPPALTLRTAIAGGLLIALGLAAVVVLAPHFPALSTISTLKGAAQGGSRVLNGLTVWHWLLSTVALLLAVAALAGSVRHASRRGFGAWFVIALVYLVGSQLHNLFWPSTYTGVLTTANVLRLAFALLIAAGAVVELKRVAEERSALLEVAEEHGRKLEELAQLKSSFTAMVAHELGTPLAAIRATAAVLGTGALEPAEQTEMLRTIDRQVEMLTGLTADMQAASAVERSEFDVALVPFPAGVLVAEAAAYARTLEGQHPLAVSPLPDATVLADPERIAQVLRNLLSNAAKYSAPGTSIELCVERVGDRLCFTVRDQGYGIHPDDMTRIFEKFGRGRDRSGQGVAGVGLGLYLSRRLIQQHGAQLEVESVLGAGSSFSFELEVVE